MYVKIENNEIVQYPYSIEQFRADNRNISFPSDLSNDILASHGVYPVSNDPAPTYDPTTQRVVKSNTPVLRDGKWVLTKSVVQLTADQITSREITAATQVRATRTELLQKTDWCACSDVTMSVEMATYRQALRDVPAQEGFPYNITWPTKPA
mgnify:CR=1 FL=1|tara:strand:+ start:503 stop:958 length:456 start_codon:yes stop_codon:yes gene_type:complete